MSLSNWFENFCKNLRMDATTIQNIQSRYRSITKRINIDYYGTTSETANSFYVGSYGRGTEIFTSDIDVIVRLPYDTYNKFNNYFGNGQSALIQEVKEIIKKTYSTTHLRGDGQVIVINFTDKITFEILPAFINHDGSYTYPDSNSGGNWKKTNPKLEIDSFNKLNVECNKNLKRLCRMARAWKQEWNVLISGILIDTLAYNFLKSWEYKDKSYVYYDWMTRDFFQFLMNQESGKEYWLAPGSGSRVYREGNFEYKARQCYQISLEAIQDEKDYPNLAKSNWKKIYGSKFN